MLASSSTESSLALLQFNTNVFLAQLVYDLTDIHPQCIITRHPIIHGVSGLNGNIEQSIGKITYHLENLKQRVASLMLTTITLGLVLQEHHPRLWSPENIFQSVTFAKNKHTTPDFCYGDGTVGGKLCTCQKTIMLRAEKKRRCWTLYCKLFKLLETLQTQLMMQTQPRVRFSGLEAALCAFILFLEICLQHQHSCVLYIADDCACVLHWYHTCMYSTNKIFVRTSYVDPT